MQDDNIDFDDAKPVSDVPMLAKLQTQEKERITIRLDKSTLEQFKQQAEQSGGNYQTLINQALKDYLTGMSLQEVVRTTIRQELHTG